MLESPAVRLQFPQTINPRGLALLARTHDAILTGVKESAHNILRPEDEERIGALALAEMLEEITKIATGVELLIILDQFEEYFVYHPTDEATREFDDEFSRALVNHDASANFLISIREDWLSRLDRFKGRIPNLFENSFRIEHLERAAARQAIVRPVEKHNELILKDGNAQRAEVTSDFVDELLKQLERLDDFDELGHENQRRTGTKCAERRIQASRLQIVLRDLWDRVKGDSPPRLGIELLPHPNTARHIIQSHLNKSLEHLTTHEKTVAASFFPLLTTTSDTKFADSAEGLAERSGRSAEVIRPLLERLSARDLKILNEVGPSPARSSSDAISSQVTRWLRTSWHGPRRLEPGDDDGELFALTFYPSCCLSLSGSSAGRFCGPDNSGKQRMNRRR